MTDQIEDLFTDLRAGEIPVLRPPGTEPLRKAARRRRAALSTAAGVAVVALAGLVVFVRPGAATTPATTPATATASVPPGPAVDGPTMRNEVAKALDLDPFNPLPGEIITNTGNGPQEARRTLLSGRYQVKLNCFGTGSMDVTVAHTEVGKIAKATALTVPCSVGQQTVLQVPVVVPEPTADLTVRVVPDVTGPGQAAFGLAFEMAQADRSRWQARAWDFLGKPENTLLSSSAFMDFGTGHEDSERDERRRIRAVCVGTGTATLSAGPSDDLGSGTKKVTVRCSPTDPEVATLTYDATRTMYTQLTPDKDAAGRAAGAISVVAD